MNLKKGSITLREAELLGPPVPFCCSEPDALASAKIPGKSHRRTCEAMNQVAASSPFD